MLIFLSQMKVKFSSQVSPKIQPWTKAKAAISWDIFQPCASCFSTLKTGQKRGCLQPHVQPTLSHIQASICRYFPTKTKLNLCHHITTLLHLISAHKFRHITSHYITFQPHDFSLLNCKKPLQSILKTLLQDAIPWRARKSHEIQPLFVQECSKYLVIFLQLSPYINYTISP